MILIHINSCFYPTNWYILIHINLCHKKEIESWRYLLPSCLLHCLSPSSCCATLLSCAVDCRPPCCRPVHRRAAIAITLRPSCGHRHCRCRCRRSAVCWWLLSCCLPSKFVIACRHATVNTLVAGVNIFVRTGMY